MNSQKLLEASASSGEKFFASIFTSHLTARFTVALIIALCAIGNLPWNLDEYDQAKQAYVSYEMAQEGGNWLYQHTPRGRTATKPPLAGWISLGFHEIINSWNLAWRLPGFLCTLALLGILLREGRDLLPYGGAALAVGAFGLNLLTPRLSTLVRTDMMLTFWIFLCGWMIYRKVRDATPWTAGERWAFFSAMFAALMTKGPIIYAFLLPGMVVFVILTPHEQRRCIWSGWWTWLIPLGVFLAWSINGLMTNEQFYDDVFVKEFLSRFNQSLKTSERQQPWWFYFPHLFHKFLPWSLLAIALPLFSKNVRAAVRKRPEILWLTCWALGGLFCMTCIPSKRVDRIYPVIPPLCLLLVAMVSACQCGSRVRAWAGAAIVAGSLFSSLYFTGVVWMGYQEENDQLIKFAKEIKNLAGEKQITPVNGRDEAMILYVSGKKSLQADEAMELWKRGEANALLVPSSAMPKMPGLPSPTLVSRPFQKREDKYFLFLQGP